MSSKIHTIKNDTNGAKVTIKAMDAYYYNTNKTAQAAYDYTTNAAAILSNSLMNTFTGTKNKIINGEFLIWQRATTISGVSGSCTYCADKWYWYIAGTSVAGTYSQQPFTLGQTDVPFEPKYYARQVITNGGDSTNGVCKFTTEIEDAHIFSNKTVTLSFYAKANASKNLSVEIRQNFGTGGSPSAAVSATPQKIAITNAWIRYSLTFSVPSIVGKTIGTDGNNTSSLIINFFESAGTAFDTRTSTLGIQTGTFDFSCIQLEEGSAATIFEKRLIPFEQSLCDRYCYSILGITGGVVFKRIQKGVERSGTSMYIFIPINMRVAPTPTISTIGNFNVGNGFASGVCTSVNIITSSPKNNSLSIFFTAFTGSAAGEVCYMECGAGITVNDYFYLEADFASAV